MVTLNKKYIKEWEAVKKDIFINIQKGNYDDAFSKLDEVSKNPHFFIIPEDTFESNLKPTGSPLNELLILLAHKKIFFNPQEETETTVNKILKNTTDSAILSDERFLELQEAIANVKMKRKEEYLEELLEDPTAKLDESPVNLPLDIPDFRVEKPTDSRSHQFIEKLLELGADPMLTIPGKESFFLKMVALDSSELTSYVLTKLSDEQITSKNRLGGNILSFSLQSRAGESFKTIVEEKGHLFDLNEKFVLDEGRTLLHTAFAHWMPNEVNLLLQKGLNLNVRANGSHPVDLTPNEDICKALETTKGVIRKDNKALNDPLLVLFAPPDFKPHPAIPVEVEEFYNLMAETTKAIMVKERAEVQVNLLNKFPSTF